LPTRVFTVGKATLATATEVELPVSCSFADDAFAGKYGEEEAV